MISKVWDLLIQRLECMCEVVENVFGTFKPEERNYLSGKTSFKVLTTTRFNF